MANGSIEIPIELIVGLLIVLIPGYLSFNLFRMISRYFGLNFAQNISEIEKVLLYFLFGSFGVLPLILLGSYSGSENLIVVNITQILNNNFTYQGLFMFTFFAIIISGIIASLLVGVSLFLNKLIEFLNSWYVYIKCVKKYGFPFSKNVIKTLVLQKKQSFKLGMAVDPLITDLGSSKIDTIFTFITKKGDKIRGKLITFRPSYPTIIKIELTENAKVGDNSVRKGEVAVLREDQIDHYFIKKILNTIILPYVGTFFLGILLILIVLYYKIYIAIIGPVVLLVIAFHMYKVRKIPVSWR